MKNSVWRWAVSGLFAVFTSLGAPTQAATPMIAVGATHTCALLANGTVQCWGDDGSGQLGAGRLVSGMGHDSCDLWPGSDIASTSSCSRTPVTIPGLADVIALAAGQSHNCALLATGRLRCWGSNGIGELGNGERTRQGPRELAPPDVVGIASAVAVAVGTSHSCAALQDGSVWCWGHNSSAQLGYAPRPEEVQAYEAFSAVPIKVPGLSDAVAVSAGDYHSCALRKTGAVRCWGDNRRGQLGLGATTPNPMLPGPDVMGMADALEISSGSDRTCARLASGSVKCWGASFNATVQPAHSAPMPVSGLANVASLPRGMGSQACAVLQDGNVRCWGFDLTGSSPQELAYQAEPPVKGIGTAVGVGAGYFHTCALLAGGSVVCWESSNYPSPLGRGDAVTQERKGSAVPVGVALRGPAVALSVGSTVNCALLAGGTVQCWGMASATGNATGSTIPAPVDGIFNAVVVSSGGQSACALLADGQLRCWGGNSFAEVGNGTHAPVLSPTAPTGIGIALGVAVGAMRTCAILVDRSLMCWGARTPSQQLYWGIPVPSRYPPQPITGLRDVALVSIGRSRDCAVLTTGKVQCWSYLEASLPDEQGADNTAPVNVAGITRAVTLTNNGSSFCALESDGGMVCWGDDNIAKSALLSVPVARLSLSISGGCLLQFAGTAQCWGYNFFGELGNGTYVASNEAPVNVKGLGTQKGDVLDIGMDYDHACVLLGDGRVMCWGTDRQGSLGTGAVSFQDPAPVVASTGAGWLNLREPSGVSTLNLAADRVFDWAFAQHAQHFSGAAVSRATNGYWARCFLGSSSCLLVNESGVAHLHYLGPLSNGTLLDLGLLSNWQTEATR